MSDCGSGIFSGDIPTIHRQLVSKEETTRLMETLESRLQKRIYVSLYALFFLITLLGLSVLLEGCTGNGRAGTKRAFEVPSFREELHVSAVVTLCNPFRKSAIRF